MDMRTSRRFKDAYTDLTSDEWIAHVGEQVLQSDAGQELVRQSELTAELQLLKDQLNVTLEQMSGYNLLLNSVGWNNTQMWDAVWKHRDGRRQ